MVAAFFYAWRVLPEIAEQQVKILFYISYFAVNPLT